MSSLLSAQNDTLPYFCGFEDPVENANWVMVNGNNYANDWAIGTAVANYGTHSMYVSHNQGANAAYLNSRGSTISYRTFTLPAGVRCIVDYDWMALGNGTDQMYVCWVTDATENIHAWANNNNGVPIGVLQFAKTWNLTDTAHVSFASWRHGSFEVVGSGTPQRLVFFWTSSQAGANNPGGCVDNVQISDKNACPKPSNVQFVESTTSLTDGYLTWRGIGTSWDVRYKNSNDTAWTEHLGLTTQADTIRGLTKGIYTFWIRTHCGNQLSSWFVLDNILIYNSYAACVNYIELDVEGVT